MGREGESDTSNSSATPALTLNITEKSELFLIEKLEFS
jgi:hypothetical protein